MVMAEGTAVLRRNRPGTKAQDFYNWPDESFEEMDSTLAVQQYIQQNIRADCSNIDKILEPPEGQDEGVWKYEHLRQFCLELNGLAVKLQSECHPDTCTQMTATEQWIFLCAAHKTPKECPAIDYTRHTLDGAACLLNSNKYFPSRVSIKESSVAKLGSVCRRIYRIFSHAYFHHRQIFDEYEWRFVHSRDRFCPVNADFCCSPVSTTSLTNNRGRKVNGLYLCILMATAYSLYLT
ncbi:MOB-like protein phocein isoform X1 [Grus americana]|uniref:MOB-like protein phocein isoform X1 n=1 Tax=Grus americana TaxID=9117 RepID=UPI002407A2C8|nr:MOB-like protein phocein isoform X1 [Grus americana]